MNGYGTNSYDDDLLLKGGLSLANSLFGVAWQIILWRPGPRFETKQQGVMTVPASWTVYARDVLDLANREIAHGGRWAFGFYGPVPDPDQPSVMIADHMAAMFKDEHGDVPFTIDNADPIRKHIAAGVDDFVRMMEEACVRYAAHLKAVEVRPDQTIKAAQGQRSVDPTAGPEV